MAIQLEKTRINLKIFLIDKNHYDLRGKNLEEIVYEITNNHNKKLHASNLHIQNTFLTYHKDGDFDTWSYCFNQPKQNFYWKSFLPDELTTTQNFNVVEFSYVLFLKFNTELYCVIGGSGMSVIKRYLDNNFGIDLYQYFAKPKDDILIDLTMRSISGNISQKKNTYNQNQTLSDSINYSEIPHKIKVVIRNELKKKQFKKYSLTDNRSILEVGNYFSIRKKLSYKLLKELIRDIDKIKKDDSDYQELTLFKKVKESDLLINLDKEVVKLITDDVLSLNYSPSLKLASSDIIEVVHPSKLEKFYDCNNFSIKLKNLREDKAKIVYHRDTLYSDVVKYIFSICTDTLKRIEIEEKIFKITVKGNHDDETLTIANFFSHVAAEINLNSKKYFRIDANWYFLANEFIVQIKKEAVECYKHNKLNDDLLNPWGNNDDEDTYNLSHKDLKDYHILDKKIKENIEICDILVIKNNKIYFIHVKEGFNTKMRDLYVQVILSAKRLWNDLKNNEGISYLKNTLEYYNSKNINGKKINVKDILKRIVDNELDIVFVMAYNNRAYQSKNSLDKIGLSQSNIAKYSLVQTTKEMKEFSNFEFKIIDISEI